MHTDERRCGLFSHILLPPKPTSFLPRGSNVTLEFPPTQDVATAEHGLFGAVVAKDLYGSTCTNAIWYPPGGFMSWHTNSNNSGRRLYAAWSETGDSGMKWLDKNNKVVDDPDKPGWNLRVFDTPQWHMVYANCWRFSVGWKVD